LNDCGMPGADCTVLPLTWHVKATSAPGGTEILLYAK
jgi:hypothetical protein